MKRKKGSENFEYKRLPHIIKRLLSEGDIELLGIADAKGINLDNVEKAFKKAYIPMMELEKALTEVADEIQDSILTKEKDKLN